MTNQPQAFDPLRQYGNYIALREPIDDVIAEELKKLLTDNQIRPFIPEAYHDRISWIVNHPPMLELGNSNPADDIPISLYMWTIAWKYTPETV